jgi:hypothetical protein
MVITQPCEVWHQLDGVLLHDTIPPLLAGQLAVQTAASLSYDV